MKCKKKGGGSYFTPIAHIDPEVSKKQKSNDPSVSPVKMPKKSSNDFKRTKKSSRNCIEIKN